MILNIDRRKVVTSLRDPIVRNSIAIMATTAVTSLLGYIFWIVVSRGSGTDAAGTGAALTSAMQMAVMFASVGGPSALLAKLPTITEVGQWRETLTATAVVSTALACVGGMIAAMALGPNVIQLLGTVQGFVAFVVLCMLISLSLILDAVLVCEYRTFALVMKNSLMSASRIPLYLLAVHKFSPEESILISWGLAAAVSILFALVAFGSRDGKSMLPRMTRIGANAWEMRHAFVGQHLVTAAAQAATFLLPIIVLALLSPTDNAYFYAAWMLGGVFFIVSPAVSSALFVESAANTEVVSALARRSLITITVILVPPMIVFLACGGLLLSLFGHDYAEHARMLLVILTLSAIPDSLTNIAVSVLRVTGRVQSALWLNLSILVACLVGAVLLLPIFGIEGAGIAWLVSQSVGALWVMARWKWIVGTSAAVEEV